MYTPYGEQPRILSGVVRPIECFREGYELIKNEIFLFVGLAFVASLLGGLTCGILSGAMFCGLALCYLGKARRQPVQFDTLFRGFEFFKQSFVVVLIFIAVYIVTSAPNFTYTLATSPIFTKDTSGAADPFTLLIGYAIQFVTTYVQQIVQIVMMLACLFVVDRGLEALDAVKMGFRVLTENLGGFLGLAALNVVATIAGMLACCVGLLFVLPVIYAATVAAYLRAFPDASVPPAAYDPPQPSPFRPPYG